MKKFILLTTALLSSANVWGACTPPITFKCNCAHPIIENGQLACGTSYCGDKKCMPDGSCCPELSYCESTEKHKECCSDGQTCDKTKGCIEGKDLETLCENAKDGGTIISATNGKKFCMYKNNMSWSNYMTWDQAKDWCESNGMTMPSIYEMCPSWDRSSWDLGACPEFSNNTLPSKSVWSATPELDNDDHHYTVYLGSGILIGDRDKIPTNANSPLCH